MKWQVRQGDQTVDVLHDPPSGMHGRPRNDLGTTLPYRAHRRKRRVHFEERLRIRPQQKESILGLPIHANLHMQEAALAGVSLRGLALVIPLVSSERRNGREHGNCYNGLYRGYYMLANQRKVVTQ